MRVFKFNNGDFNYVGKHDITSKETLKKVYFNHINFPFNFPVKELEKHLRLNNNKLKYNGGIGQRNISIGKEYEVENIKLGSDNHLFIKTLLDNGVKDEVPIDDFEYKKMEIRTSVNKDYYPTRLNLNLRSTKILMIHDDGDIEII